jgi:flagellar basal-body rod protein FlgB
MISGKRMNESVLDILVQNNKIIANNIANVDTPNYKAKKLVFQEELQRQLEKDSNQHLALKKTHAKHLPTERETSTVPFRILEMKESAMNNNKNSVDIDLEMASLAKNQMAYNLLVDRVSSYYTTRKKILSDLR